MRWGCQADKIIFDFLLNPVCGIKQIGELTRTVTKKTPSLQPRSRINIRERKRGVMARRNLKHTVVVVNQFEPA